MIDLINENHRQISFTRLRILKNKKSIALHNLIPGYVHTKPLQQFS